MACLLYLERESNQGRVCRSGNQASNILNLVLSESLALICDFAKRMILVLREVSKVFTVFCVVCGEFDEVMRVEPSCLSSNLIQSCYPELSHSLEVDCYFY